MKEIWFVPSVETKDATAPLSFPIIFSPLIEFKIFEFLDKNETIDYAYSLAKEYVKISNRLPDANVEKSYIYEWSENWLKKLNLI